MAWTRYEADRSSIGKPCNWRQCRPGHSRGALVAPGVSVASVADVSNYGLLTNIEQKQQRLQVLERFANMYGPAVGTGQVMEYLGLTGLDALKGADILKIAPEQYESSVGVMVQVL